MIKIVEFYFKTISQIISKVWGSFKIFDGVSYAYWIMGTILFLLVLKIVTFGYGTNGIQNIKSYKKNHDQDSNG